MNRKRVGIIIFNNVEVLDFCGPFEVFSTARLNEAMRETDPSPFEVLLIAEKPEPVSTVGGMCIVPQHTFTDCPHLDILVVPGGRGAREEQMDNPVILDWICSRAKEVETLTSVCTGAMLLGKAGLLAGLPATTHWRSLDRMRDMFPNVAVKYDKHFIHQEHVYTSAGISAGIDMSLKVVEEYFGGRVARATAKNMEYPYPEDDERRINRD
jgi:transcriptional regulator GlxA family with amidase domain